MIGRWRHFVNDEVQSSDAATWSFNLPETGQLHALLITVKATNGATAGRNVSALDVVDFVRVIGNGDERIFELSSQEIEKWQETMFGIPLSMKQDETAGTQQFVVLPILFGRNLDDPNYYLPLNKIRNPRLEVTYSPPIAADGGFVTGTTTINVMGLWSSPAERMQYGGTLYTRTIKAFTSLASGDDKTAIEITDPIRAIGIYCYEAGTEDGLNITRARLEVNSGEYDVFAGDWADLQNVCKLKHWARIVHNFKAFWQDNDTLLTRLGNIKNVQLHNFGAQDVAQDTFTIRFVDGIAGDQLTLDAGVADVTAGAETHVTDVTDRLNFVEVEGETPSYFTLMTWAEPDAAQGYLDPKQFDRLNLVLTQGNAGANVRVGLQFLKFVGD